MCWSSRSSWGFWRRFRGGPWSACGSFRRKSSFRDLVALSSAAFITPHSQRQPIALCPCVRFTGAWRITPSACCPAVSACWPSLVGLRSFRPAHPCRARWGELEGGKSPLPGLARPAHGAGRQRALFGLAAWFSTKKGGSTTKGGRKKPSPTPLHLRGKTEEAVVRRGAGFFPTRLKGEGFFFLIPS